jgi:hypothetical protein
LPKVPFAISELPAGFFPLFGKEKPSLLVKWVLAAVFIWQRGKVIWRGMLTLRFVPPERRREHECHSFHNQLVRTG